MTDNCDCVGLVEIDFKLTSADCGQKITKEHVAELGDRIQDVGENRYFIPTFIEFQYGEISETCPAHRPVIRQITRRGLIHDGIAYRYPSNTLSSQVVENQQIEYPSDRVALPYRKGKGKDNISTGEGGAGGNGIIQFRLRVGELYNRKPEDRWSYEEERNLFEVHKRPSHDSELSELCDYRKRIETKFFPNSVLSLLEKWSSTLDRARTKNQPTKEEAAAAEKAISMFVPPIPRSMRDESHY